MARRVVVAMESTGRRRDRRLGDLLAAGLVRRWGDRGVLRGGDEATGAGAPAPPGPSGGEGEGVSRRGLAEGGARELDSWLRSFGDDVEPWVVYLPSRRDPAVRRAVAVAEAVAARPGSRLVLVTSTEIHEPSHRQPGLIGEDGAGPRAPDHPVAHRWWRIEKAVAEALAGSGAAAVVLRAAPVPVAGGGDWVSELFAGRAARTPSGYDPPLQLLTLPDFVAGVARAVEAGAARPVGEAGAAAGAPPVFHLVPAQPVPLGFALRLAGVRRVPWPLRRGAGGPQVGRGGGSGEAGGRGWPYLAHPWTASGARAADAFGFHAAHTSAQAAAAVASGDPWRPDPAVDLCFDEHGMSPRYIAGFSRTLFRFLHDAWWRVEQRGVEHVPRRGRAVLVGVHRGFMPWDGVMALHLLRRERGRLPRFLIHPSLVKFPFLANYMRRLGGVLACRENADLVLRREGLLAIFPEGIRGAFRAYDGGEVYRLGNFGRRDYVRLALAHGAPIVPFVTVGSAEIYPILGRLDWQWARRLTEWPYLPLTPTFPWLPLPLPSKWHTHFLEPVETAGRWSPRQADDPEAVAEIGDEVESRMQAAIDEMLAARRSWWRGSVFADQG